MNLFTKLFRSRDKPQNFYHFSGWPFVFGRSASGKKVNEFTAMQTTAVYACVRILAESIASLPLHVYEYKGQGKERVPGHSLYFLLHDSPNLEMTSFIFRETAMIHLLITLYQRKCDNFKEVKKYMLQNMFPQREAGSADGEGR